MYYNFPPAKQKQLLTDHLDRLETISNLNFKVNKRLQNPHWIVRNFLNKKEFKKPKVYRSQEYFENGNMTLDVYENNKKRSIRIMDSLLKNIEQLGYSFKFKRPGLFIEKDKIIIRIHIQEKHKRVKNKDNEYPTYVLVPTGFLKIQFSRSLHTKEYVERKNFFFDENILKLLGYIETFRDLEENHQKTLEKGWAEQRKRREEETKIKAKISEDLDVFKSFVELSQLNEQLQKLTKFKAELELKLDDNSKYAGLSKTDFLNKIEHRLKWLDPFSNTKDDLLTEDHKITYLDLLK